MLAGLAKVAHDKMPWDTFRSPALAASQGRVIATRAASWSSVSAVDGPSGVGMATSEKPDLILMDVVLGAMDGWEATQLIKSDPNTHNIPIIALTAHALASDRDRSIAVGRVDFDTKPVDFSRLMAKLRLHVGVPSEQ
jgi:CheY-like chemotaxis protein